MDVQKILPSGQGQNGIDNSQFIVKFPLKGGTFKTLPVNSLAEVTYRGEEVVRREGEVIRVDGDVLDPVTLVAAALGEPQPQERTRHRERDIIRPPLPSSTP